MALNPKKRTKSPRLKRAKQEIRNNLGSGTIANFNMDTWEYEDVEFDSLEAIFKDIKKRIHFGVDWATKYVFNVLEYVIEDWYNDYTPEKYVRTETLYNASDMYVSGYGGHVFISNYLSYTYPPSQPPSHSGSEVLEYAETGLHGATYPKQGDKGVGIWGELIYYLMNDEVSDTNASVYGSLTDIGDSEMIYLAFDAGIAAGARAAFGKKK